MPVLAQAMQVEQGVQKSFCYQIVNVCKEQLYMKQYFLEWVLWTPKHLLQLTVIGA